MISLQIESVKLTNPYVFNKIDPKTLRRVLDSANDTVYQLYLITNGIKERQDFASIESAEYALTAYVKTECGFSGEAKKQVWNVTHLQSLLLKKPKYTLRCELKHIPTNNTLYKCRIEHKNPEKIYDQMQCNIFEINHILSETKNNITI